MSTHSSVGLVVGSVVLAFGAWLFFEASGSRSHEVLEREAASTGAGESMFSPLTSKGEGLASSVADEARTSAAGATAAATSSEAPGQLTLDLNWGGTPDPAVRIATRLIAENLPEAAVRRASSDAQGRVRYTDLAAGVYRIELGRQELRVALEAGANEQRTIELVPKTDFRGEVLTPDGVPVPGADILCYGGGSVELTAGPMGKFHLRSLERFLNVAARAESYGPSDVQLIPKDPEEIVQLVLSTAGASIEGQVLTPSGDPATNVKVVVGNVTPVGRVRKDGSVGEQAELVAVITDELGRFRAVGVRPGTTDLQVRAIEGVSMEWTGQVEAVAGETQVVVIHLQRAASVRGIVLSGAGEALAWVRVAARWGPQLHQRQTTVTEDDGQFVFVELPAGSVQLDVSQREHGTATATVELREGNEFYWTATLQRRGTPGRVLHHDGRAAAGVHVQLTAVDFEARAVTDQDGVFLVPDCPAVLDRVVAHRGAVGSIVLGTWSNVDAGAGGLELRLAEGAGLPCTFVLRVLEPTGGIAEDARLYIADVGDSPRLMSGPPGEEGFIRIGPIFGSEFHVHVKSPRFGKASLGIARPDASGKVDLGTCRLSEPGRLFAGVSTAGGGPSVASFRIEGPDGLSLYDVASLPENGLLLAPGAYVLRVIEGEQELTRQPFRITEGQPTNLLVELGGSDG